MEFSTIIHERNIYHGIVLSKSDNGFVFAFRVDGRTYSWECNYDYWRLIE